MKSRIPDTHAAWAVWGASRRGTSHAALGLPNQDSCLFRRYPWGELVVVADGLGSCSMSQTGSACICRAVARAACFQARLGSVSALNTARLAHAYWCAMILPHTVEECATTCLFAVRYGDRLSMGRLGDGIAVALGEGGNGGRVMLDSKADSFLNITDCLKGEFRAQEWELAEMCAGGCRAVLLSTDGMTGGCDCKAAREFAVQVVTHYTGMKPAGRSAALLRDLRNFSRPDFTDDCTVACMNREGDVADG